MHFERHISLLFAFLICFFLLVVSVVGQDEVADLVQDVSITIADKKFVLLFEKQDVPLSLKNTIAADIERTLSYVPKVLLEKQKKERKLSTEHVNVVITHMLLTDVKSLGLPSIAASSLLPECLQDAHFGETAIIRDTYYLVIRKKVIEAYTHARNLKKNHPVMFEKLDDFIELLENNTKLQRISQDWETCNSYIYRHGDVSRRNALKWVKELASLNMRVVHPSLLEVRYLRNVDGQSLDYPKDAFVIASIIKMTKNGTERFDKLPLGAYVNGEWRIFAFHMP